MKKYSKKILVTGGLGFIGSNYINKFTKKYPDYLFINVDCMTYAASLDNIRNSKIKNYILEKIDIREIKSLEKIFLKYRPTSIIHFAAESHVDMSISNPGIFVETIISGTHNLLELAVKYGVKRFHQISTDEVYGSLGKNDPPFTVNSSVAPNSPYSASKASADLLVRSYNKTFGLNTVTTRCSNNYGPNQDKTKLIPKTILNLISNKKIPIYGKGDNVRDWVYVEDHIDAIDLVFHKGLNGKIYNIGGNTELKNIDLVKILIKMIGRNENNIQYVEDRKGHDFRYAIDTSEIKRDLGWSPKIPINNGLKKTVAYYRLRKDKN